MAISIEESEMERVVPTSIPPLVLPQQGEHTLRSIVAAATHLQRSRANEDAFECGYSPLLDSRDENDNRPPLGWMMVADGVGGSQFGGPAAHAAAEGVKQFLSCTPLAYDAGCDALAHHLLQAHQSAKNAVIAACEQFQHQESSSSPSQWCTTLIIVQETATHLGVAYLGDGAVFHATTAETLTDNGEDISFDIWRWRNLLSPHLAPLRVDPSRNALTRFVSAKSGISAGANNTYLE